MQMTDKFLQGIWLVCLLLVFISTGSLNAATGDPKPVTIADVPNAESPSASRPGMQVYESDRGRQLLGEIVPADLPRLLPDWDREMATYIPDPGDILAIAEFSQQVEIICVLGTWCSDSEREVPRFWKILNEAANPHLELTMFAVGRSSDEQAMEIMQKTGFEENLRDVYAVELVPTFIFSVAGHEIGRIIETSTRTLEGDMVGILLENEAGSDIPAWR